MDWGEDRIRVQSMAWENRETGRYFYKRTTRDGKSVRIYVGNGPAAHHASRELEEKRHHREQNKVVDSVLEELGRPILDLDLWADQLTRAALMADGYVQHHRCEWRRKRNENKPDQT